MKYFPILKILTAILCVAAVVFVILAATEINFLSMLANDKAVLSEKEKRTFQECAVQLFGNIGYFVVTLTSVWLFVSTLRDGTPFTKKTSNILFLIAAEIFITAFIAPFAGKAVTMSVIGGSYIFANGTNDMFAGVLLFAVSTFFRYGTMLQQESDETL